MKIFYAISVLLTLILVSPPAKARTWTTTADLAGISALSFEVHSTSAALARCGSNESSFRNSMTLPILYYTKIKHLPTLDLSHPNMIITVDAENHVDGKCSFAVQILVQVYVDNIILPYQTESRGRRVDIWKGHTFGTLDSIHAKVEQVVKGFASDWLKENKKR
jgi:hypothetical protein